MKIWLKIWSVLIVTLLCVSCDDDKEPVDTPYTVLCYLVGNDSFGSMDDALKENVVGIYKSLAAGNTKAQVLVYYRPKKDDSQIAVPTIYEFKSDGRGNINGKQVATKNVSLGSVLQTAVVKKTYPGTDNSMNPVVMKTVMTDLKSYSVSGNYILIMGTHATGWLEAKKTISTRSMGNDDGYSINLPEFRDVLSSVFNRNNLECLFLDACMMGTTEVAYDLRNVARHFIFSVMETPLAGYPYEQIIPILLKENIHYQRVCDEFKTYYTAGGWGTSAVVKAEAMDQLAAVVKSELGKIPDFSSIDLTAIQQYGADHWISEETDWNLFSFDVADFFRVANNGVIPATITDALRKTVVAKSVLTQTEFYGVTVDENKYSGLGMYLPMAERFNWNNYYKKLSWYTAVGWNSYYP